MANYIGKHAVYHIMYNDDERIIVSSPSGTFFEMKKSFLHRLFRIVSVKKKNDPERKIKLFKKELRQNYNEVIWEADKHKDWFENSQNKYFRNIRGLLA